LHPVARRREVATGQLLHLAHAVPERVAVYEQLRRGGLPPGVAFQERLQRRNEMTAVPLVVLVERAQDTRGEGGERHGILQRQEQLVRAEVAELSLGPAFGLADLQRVPSLPDRLLQLPVEDHASR